MESNTLKEKERDLLQQQVDALSKKVKEQEDLIDRQQDEIEHHTENPTRKPGHARKN